MQLIDTHAHLYLPEFEADLDEIISSSRKAGIVKIFMPNIDSSSLQPMLELSRRYEGYCYPMIGLHPCSVNLEFEKELELMDEQLADGNFIGIGETGTDLYWDKTYFELQVKSLEYQVQLAKKYRLPLILHCRDSMEQTIEVIGKHSGDNLTGIFHCFSGDLSQAKDITGMGFKLGIGGVATFKNAKLPAILEEIEIENIVLETDSPYLAPVPFRGKRNEPAHLVNIVSRLAEIKKISPDLAAGITTQNALNLFSLAV